jgi:DNA-binding PadR family transcriptional regulator
VAVRQGILTLLAEEPKYGYQLKRELEAATGDAWTLNVGQVYTTLQRLERDGLVIAEDVESDQQRYRLTQAGSDEVAAWMSTPVDRRSSGRDALSIKILLAINSSFVDPADVIRIQRTATMANLQDLQHLRTEAAGDEIAWLLELDRLVFQAESELRWLDRVEDRLAGGLGQSRILRAGETEPGPEDSTAMEAAHES